MAVYVANSDEAVCFWVEQVAFELRPERSMRAEKWIEVAPPGAVTALTLYPKSMMTDWDSRPPSVVCEAADIEATCRALETNGVEFSQRSWIRRGTNLASANRLKLAAVGSA